MNFFFHIGAKIERNHLHVLKWRRKQGSLEKYQVNIEID